MATFEDNTVRSLGRQLAKVYSEARKGLTEKVDSFFAQFKELDAKKAELVKAGKLAEAKYLKWRQNKLLMGEKYKELRDSITDNMLHANKRAASIINHEIPNVYAHNFNQVGEGVERKVQGYSFDLTNPETVRKLATDNTTLLPYKYVDGHRDVRWNSTKVNSQIMQGILQGESADQMATRLMGVTRMNEESALRNARTAVTSAQNKGRIDAMKQCEDDGVIMGKEWIATKDERTREAHEELDRVVVKVDEPFVNEIGEIMYPGDPDADPANTYNCRCTIAEVVMGFKPKEEVQEEKEEQEEQDVNALNEPTYSVKEMVEPERPRRSDFEDEDAYYAARDEYRAEREAFNQQMEEKINEAVSVERFETKEDFVAWAEENNILLMDDVADKIDLRAMNEASQTLDEMFERFPELKAHDSLDFDGSTYHYQFALMADSDGFMEWRGGIAFGEQRFGNYESAVRDALYSMVDGHNVMGDGTFSTMIRHECGHGIEDYIRTNVIGKGGILTLDDWRGHFQSLDAYRSACDEVRKTLSEYDADLRSLFKAGMGGQSEYAGQDLRELFAEGFAEWSSGGQTEFGKAFGEFFGRWYK